MAKFRIAQPVESGWARGNQTLSNCLFFKQNSSSKTFRCPTLTLCLERWCCKIAHFSSGTVLETVGPARTPRLVAEADCPNPSLDHALVRPMAPGACDQAGCVELIREDLSIISRLFAFAVPLLAAILGAVALPAGALAQT